MTINIYGNYQVKMTTKGASLDEYGDFKDFEYKEQQTLDGGKLLEQLKIILASSWIQAIIITDKIIKVEIFNAMTGEGENVIYEIEEL